MPGLEERAFVATPPEVESQAWQSVTRGAELGVWLQQVSTMPLLRHVAERSMALLAVQPGQHILEVGCGSGVFLPLLAEAVGETGRVVGLDRAAEFVQQARERAHQFRWIEVDEGDAYALPYAGQSFDAAVCDRVLMHLDDPSAVLVQQANAVRRQPYIGRELNRRMAAVGLTDRRIEKVPILSL